MKTITIDSLPLDARLREVLGKINFNKLPKAKQKLIGEGDYRKVQIGDTLYLIKKSLIHYHSDDVTSGPPPNYFLID